MLAAALPAALPPSRGRHWLPTRAPPMLARSAAGRRRRAGLKQSLLDHFREQAGFCFLIDVIHWPGRERRTLGITDGHVRFIDTSP